MNYIDSNEVLYIFDQHLINTDARQMIIFKDEAELYDIKNTLVLHYSDNYEQYLNLDLPSKIRKPKKLISLKDCWNVISKLEYGTMAMNTDGYPYLYGMNHIIYEGRLFFHSALKGYKLKGINQKATINFIEDLHINEDVGTHNHRSVSVYGTLKEIKDLDLKKTILLKLIKDFAPKHPYHDKMLETTNILELEIDYINGKEHIY